MELALLLGFPVLGAALLGITGAHRRAPEINAVLSLATFLASCALTVQVIRHGNLLLGDEQFFIDPFNVFLVALTAFVGLTTALFSRPYMRVELDHGRLTPGRLRLYHSMYQLFMFTMLLALTTNNMGLMWVAMEGATLSTVLLVTLYRTPQSLEAGWKYFILCGVGIAQALFGTILLYVAAEKVLGAQGVTALLWTHLDAVKSQLEPTVLALAFVFLLIGYGTKVGLVPLHSWLPDAHAEGPTPISAVLSGLLLNVALYAVVRSKVLVEGSLHSRLPSVLLMGFGLVSVVLASLLLWRQRDIKRLFAYSSIEHMGIATLAFGIGGPLATFAGLLHMTAHSLVKSAIFFVVGHIVQTSGSQKILSIREVAARTPGLSRALLAGGFAITGLPPFALFASEFLIVSEAARRAPYTVPFLLFALFVTFGIILFRILEMNGGGPPLESPVLPSPPLTFFPVWIHLGVALVMGLFFPALLASVYQKALLSLGPLYGG